MPLPSAFLSKSEVQLHRDLVGLPATARESVLRMHSSGDVAQIENLLPALLAYYLPRGSAPLPELQPQQRLHEDLGLDSLALAELVFKLDEVFGVAIELREVTGVLTVADLQGFLRAKLDPQQAAASSGVMP
jgi:acyl carrier protein